MCRVRGAVAPSDGTARKSVQYVKICSLYGAGFYYIPGTDTCIKVGGWVRMQMGYGYNGNMTNGPFGGTSAANVNNRTTNDFMTRNRGYITADARSQTEYGTLRGYIAVGLSNDNPIPGMTGSAASATSGGSVVAGTQGGVGFSANRAFIQFAGFTAGLSQSFYDYANYAAVSYNGGNIWTAGGADTGDGGYQVFAYTAQLGNGLSATISAENPRNGSVSPVLVGGGAVSTALGTTGFPSPVNGAAEAKAGNKYPDIVANLRVDQAWGGAQVMGAIHDASAAYYDIPLAGHPANATGYALGAGARVNLPMLGVGDYIQAQFNWTKGAVKYMSLGSNVSYTSGGTSGSGTYADGLYQINGTDTVHLTTAWSTGASYEHNWNPKWKTSVYGGYASVSLDRASICTVANAAAGCSGDWSTWQIGTRTAWAPVNNLEVGVDVMYDKLNARNLGTASQANIDGSVNQSAWIAHLRIQRNFYP